MKRKYLSIFIIFVLFLGILGPSSSYAEEGTTIKLALHPAIDGKYQYYTNEETLVYLDLDLSGYNANIENGELILTVPKEYLNTFVGSKIGSATGPVAATTSDGYYTLTYQFDQLTGGTSIRIPLRIQTLAGTTPNNYVLPISVALNDEHGATLASGETLNLTQVTRTPSLAKWKVVNGSNTSADGSTSYGGAPSLTDSNLIQPGSEVYQVFNFGVAFPSVSGTTLTNYLGIRKYEKIVITDTLPEGAVFVASANPGWTFDPVTNMVSYTMTSPNNFTGSTSAVQLSMPSLKLIFPNGDTRKTYTNTAQAEFFPVNKQDYEGDNTISKDGISFSMTTNLPTGAMINKSSSNFMDQVDSKSATQSWTCSFTNPSDTVNMENLVLEDNSLDARMDYVSVRLAGGTGSYVGTVRIECVDANGMTTVLAASAPWNGTTEYPVPAGTVRILLKSNTGGYLQPLKAFTFYVKTKLKDPVAVHYDPVQTINNRFNNTLKGSGEYVGSDLVINGIRTSYISITEYKPTVYLQKTSSVSSLFVDEETTFTLTARGSGTMMSPDTINGSTLIDLLPQGLEYVAGSTTMSVANAALFTSKEPTRVDNYKGSGRTALIWQTISPLAPNTVYYTLSYRAKATKEMTQGANTNAAYWIWDNNGSGDSSVQQVVVSTPANGKADTYDFDNDGNKNETAAYASAVVTYVPPREVIATKYVKGSMDMDDTIRGGRTEIGSDFTYTLKIWNNSINVLSKLTALEVLPYPGDKVLVSGNDGVFLPRNSQYQVLLTGPVVGPVGFTVYYTTDLPESDSASSTSDYSSGAGWVGEALVSDWGAIRGIKIEMNAGLTLLEGQTVKFTIPVKSPDDMSLVDGATSNNSFAVSVNGGKDFLEATAVPISVVSYAVKGTIFNDIDRDGVMEDGEPGLAGRPVQLFNKDGSPALDLDGNPIKSITNSDGAYLLSAYRQGEYYVQVGIPSYYEVSQQGENDQKTASHINQTTGQTSAFTLAPDNNQMVRNGGMYRVTGDLSLQKTVLDADGNKMPVGEGPYRFEIALDGVPYDGGAIIDGEIVHITDGKLSTKSGQDIWIRNIPEGSTYEVKEVDTGEYTQTPSEGSYSGVIKAEDQVVLSFTNQEKPLGQLTINKVLVDAEGNPIEETREFTIKVTGPSFPDGQEMTVKNGTPLELSGLKYGTYQVEELNATLYNVKVSDVAMLSVENKQGAITVTNQEKQIASPPLKIQKIVKGEPKADETFLFLLTPLEGEPIYPAFAKDTIDEQEAAIAGIGTALFDSWNYTKPGVYVYQVTEVTGDNDDYIYDKTIYTITDTVSLNESGDLEVSRAIQNENGASVDGTLTFTNQYKPHEEFPITPENPDPPTKPDNSNQPNHPHANAAVRTGDYSQPLIMAVVAGLSALILLLLALQALNKKRRY